MSFGAYPPIYSDIVNSLCQISNTDRQIQPYVYGLGGRDIFQSDVKKIFNDLINENISSEIKFIGTNNI
jgi:pyruvate/2-oxoacid:ferredoxin oxidoreductase alpha subunit